MTDEVKIVISTDVTAAKRDVAKLAKGFKEAEQAANKTTTAVEKTNKVIKKQESFWTTLGKRLRSFVSGAGLANEAFRIMRLRAMNVTRSIAQFAIRSTKASSDFLGFRNALQIASGSLVEANRSMQQADEIATTLGLDLTSVTKEYSKFVNSVTLAGQTMQFAERTFQQFAVTARVLNLNGQETSGMFLALEQMVSKGTVSMEELRRQLGQHLPGAVALAAKSMGYGKDQLKEFYSEVRKGNIASDELVGNLGNLLAKRTAPLLQQALQKSTVAVTRFKNELLKLQVTIGQYLQPVVTWFFNSLATLVGWFRTAAFESTIFQNELKDVADALKNTATAIAPVVVSFNNLKSTSVTLSESFEASIGAIGLLGVTAITGAKSLQLLGKAAKWMLDPFIKFGKWLGKSKLGSLATKINPVTAIVTALGVALIGTITWLERTQSAADAADQSWRNFTIGLKGTKGAVDEAKESLYELATTMEGIQRIGATYAGSFGEIQKLQKEQADLNSLISSTSQLMLKSNTSLGSEAMDVFSNQLVVYKERLQEIPKEIEKLNEKQGKFKVVLESLGSATDKENKKTAVKLTLIQKAALAYAEETKLLGYIIEDTETAVEMTERYNLAKQGWNQTQIDSILLMREEAEIAKEMAEWKKEQADAVESPNTDLFDNFDETPLQEFLTEIPDLAITAESVMINSFKGMEDAIVSFATTGKNSFGDFAKSIIADLSRMIIKQLMFNAISSMFGGGLLSNAAPIAGQANLAGIPSQAGALINQYATGTDYVPRDGLAYLHKGEAVTPAKENNRKSGQAGTTIININGVTDFGSFKKNESQLTNAFQHKLSFANRNL